MPVLVNPDLPAFPILKAEGRSIAATERSFEKFRVALVNLMPTKIQTETQFARLLSFCQETVGLELVHMETHNHQCTDMEHIRQFYRSSSWLYSNKPDGIIVTGAPVELLEFE